jgi:Na+/proline symporter/signal transduction histidine kinase
MFESWAIVALAIGYVCTLFVIAWLGDRVFRPRERGDGRPLIYALSLAVYCTSWTFFGSVGLAAATGYDFVPIYLGPILMFVLGWPLILRIVRLSKSQNITSLADFLAARYGKSQAVAAIVTLVAVVGTLPYIALQLKAIVISTETILGGNPLVDIVLPRIGFVDTALVVAVILALFAVLFGTRHIDATEHQDGLMLAIAAESLVKLATFLTVGIFILLAVFGGIGGFVERLASSSTLEPVFRRPIHGSVWVTSTFLSMCCIVLLPRQFHVTVVENTSEREVKRASWLLPLYLVLINLFVVPIAAAGLLVLPKGLVEPDMFLLALPMAKDAHGITTLAYIGGLSAATAMVIVESIALSIMVSNGLVIPLMLRNRMLGAAQDTGLTSPLLMIRRVAIVAIVLLGYLVFRALGQSQGLAAIGLISFAAIAQLAPSFFGGLFWRNGTARGAIAGILAGFAFWVYTLLLPWVVKAGWLSSGLLSQGPFGIGFLRPQALLYLPFEPLTHGVAWSLGANLLAYVLVSIWRAPEPIERLQARLFVPDDAPRAVATPAFKLWRTAISVDELQSTVARYLGAERAERSFEEFATSRSVRLDRGAEADIHLLRFAEHLLTSAIGAASARLVLSLLLRRSNVGSQSALRLLDDASEALQYNRDLLQSALDQVRHGLSVFDKDMRLICWNRQFRELLDLPTELGRVGVPLDTILRRCAERGDFGQGDVEALVADRIQRLAVTKEAFQERFSEGARIIEIRTAPMPQGGIVTTYSDITERVTAASALERRVAERTAELVEVNTALEAAKAKADAASLDKTRFIAAASHDILQPLNAARLYASSLVERKLGTAEGEIARNIDASLVAVEEILGALIEISRIDAGHLEPEITNVDLAELFQQLAVEFGPLARERALDLRIVPTRAWVRTDRRLLRRLLQNLVSNAVKYTRKGRVLVGTRRRAGSLVIEVVDTGPGIPASKHALIFREFQRLDETAHQVRGLGLGLSIVERIGRVLDAPIGLVSEPGKGSTFSVSLPLGQPQARMAAEPAPALPPGSISGLVVLCIDNEPAVLEGMRTLLTSWGCIVASAESIEQATLLVTGRGIVPNVIMADFHLDRGTGLDAIAAVRSAARAPVPAVIITADPSPEVQRWSRELGHVLLRKPIKAATLRSLLMQYALRRAAAE